MMKETCSILLLSCDKNIDLIRYNILLLQKYWSKCPFKIYIGLEENKHPHLDTTLNVKCLYFKSNIGWSERVINYLKVIPTEIVLILLDDFWLEKKLMRK